MAGSREKDCSGSELNVPGCLFCNQHGSNEKQFKTHERIKAGDLGLRAVPGTFTFNLYYNSRDKCHRLHFIAVETSSEMLGNLCKVTQPVYREARIRNLLPKSQKRQVRLAGLRAKEPQKCSHVCPRLKRPGTAWLTFQQRKCDPDSTEEGRGGGVSVGSAPELAL